MTIKVVISDDTGEVIHDKLVWMNLHGSAPSGPFLLPGLVIMMEDNPLTAGQAERLNSGELSMTFHYDGGGTRVWTSDQFRVQTPLTAGATSAFVNFTPPVDLTA